MQKDLNFFSVYKAPLSARPAGGRLTVAGIAAVSVCAAAVLGFFVFFRVETFRTRAEIAEIKAYLGAADVVKAQSRAENARNKAQALAQYAGAASSQAEIYRNAARPDSSSLREILQAAPSQTTVESLACSGSRLTVSCVSADVYAPALYTHALKEKGYADASFSELTGPTGRDTSGCRYRFSIALSVKGGKAQ